MRKRKLKLSRETLLKLQDLKEQEGRWVAGGWVCTDYETTCPTLPKNSCRCSIVC